MKCGSCLLVNEFLNVYSPFASRVWKQDRCERKNKQNSKNQNKKKKEQFILYCNMHFIHLYGLVNVVMYLSTQCTIPSVLFQCIVLENYLGKEVEKVGGTSINYVSRRNEELLFFVDLNFVKKINVLFIFYIFLLYCYGVTLFVSNQE